MSTIEKWMQNDRLDLPQEQIVLLKRAKATLEGNIAVPDEGSEKPLAWHPLRGIRPSSEKYPGVWNWDSAFHAMAVARWDPELAREQVLIFLDAQMESGCLPDVLYTNGTAVTEFGKPPVFPWALAIVNGHDPNVEFLAIAYKKFAKYEAFWMDARGGSADGLFHYDGASSDPECRDSYARMESGWDDTVRFDRGSYALWSIDLNCYMVMLYQAMRCSAETLGKSDEARKWQDREHHLSEKINAELWNDQLEAYTDRNRSTGEYSEVLSPASFMPLFAGIAPPDRAGKMAQLAASTTHFNPGMPTVSYDNPAYESGAYWRGPTWLNVAYFALRGLKDYGFEEVADAGRNTILDWCYANEDGIYEYYDSRSGKGSGARHFGWSAAFIIEFILNWKAVPVKGDAVCKEI